MIKDVYGGLVMRYTVTDLEKGNVHKFDSINHLIYFITYNAVWSSLDFMSELNKSGKDMCTNSWGTLWLENGAGERITAIHYKSSEKSCRLKRFIVRDEYNRIVSLDEYKDTIKSAIKAAREDKGVLRDLRLKCISPEVARDKRIKAEKKLPKFRCDPIPGTGAKYKYYQSVIRRGIHTKATAVDITDEDYGKFIRNKRKEVVYVGSYFCDNFRTVDHNWKKMSKARKQYMVKWRGYNQHSSESLRSLNIAKASREEELEMAYLDDDIA